MSVLSERAVTAAEARDVLARKASAEGATYEQKIALDHLKKNVKLTVDDAKKMWVELESTGKLTAEQIAQVINIMPQKPEELKGLFSKERVVLSSEDTTKILDTVKKYL